MTAMRTGENRYNISARMWRKSHFRRFPKIRSFRCVKSMAKYSCEMWSVSSWSWVVWKGTESRLKYIHNRNGTEIGHIIAMN